MTFKEIIMAAMEETCGKEHQSRFHNGRVWDFNGREIFMYRSKPHEITIRCFYNELLTIYASELLDPSWSPATLAKQIRDALSLWAKYPKL